MLNDKSRGGLRHLPARRKWASLIAGMVLRLPASEIRGGWAAGWHDFYPVQVECFTRDGETATVRSLVDRRITLPISRRMLEHFSEHAPFGTVQRSRPVSYVQKWWQRRKPARRRYV